MQYIEITNPTHKQIMDAIKKEFGFVASTSYPFNEGVVYTCQVTNTMPLLFESILVKVVIFDETQVAQLRYEYIHPNGGMNGYSFARVSIKDGKPIFNKM